MNVNWFLPPQLRIGEGVDESRRATWLELFFDLVFVVAVSQVAHSLNTEISWQGYLGFVGLFLPIWWAWIGNTFYANRFEVDDIGYRLLIALQMLGVAAMAVNVHHGLSETSVGFALSYVLVRLILVFQYWRAAHYLPTARPLARHYAIGFTFAAVIWFLSIFVPIPLRFVLWGIGLLVDLATPVTAARHQINLMPNFEHLPERFGLFVIIVLGEAVIAVVDGISEQAWDLPSITGAVVGFSIAFSLWWIYFENVGGSALRAIQSTGQVQVLQIWLFGHLPLVLGLTGTGVAIEHLIISNPERTLTLAEGWLLCGSVALCFLSLAALHRTGVIFQCKVRARYRIAGALVLVVLAPVSPQLPPNLVGVLVALLCAAQVAQDIYQGHPARSTSHPGLRSAGETD